MRWLFLVVLAACSEPEAPLAPEPPPPEPSREPVEAPQPEAPPPPEQPPPEPVAQAPVEDPAPEAEVVAGGEGEEDEGPPRVDPALRALERIGEGPWRPSETEAAGAGVIDFEDPLYESVEATTVYQRRTYALFSAQGEGPDYALARDVGVRRLVLWLARLEHEAANDDHDERWRRVSAVRLAERLYPGNQGDAECSVATELRARDVDGDGEVELTVLAAAGDVFDPNEECGVLGLIVGGDDLNVQARFTREYRYFHTGADGDVEHHRNTAWQLRDVNGDGRADLHVTERWTFSDRFSGDWGGDDVGTIPGHSERRSDRFEVDCLYDAAADAWVCPETPAIGIALLRPATRTFPREPW